MTPLRRHLHVHALMACGGLDAEDRWCAPKRSPTFLVPVHALSRVFRGKFLDALRHAIQAGGLPPDPANTPALRQGRLKNSCVRTGWRTPRRRWPDPRSCSTTCRAIRTAWRSRTNVSWALMPGRFACACALTSEAASAPWRSTAWSSRPLCAARLARATKGPLRGPGASSASAITDCSAPLARPSAWPRREALAVPAVNPQAREDAAAFMNRVAGIESACCAHCRVGHWLTIDVLQAEPRAPNLATVPAGDHREPQSQDQTLPHLPCAAPPQGGRLRPQPQLGRANSASGSKPRAIGRAHDRAFRQPRLTA